MIRATIASLFAVLLVAAPALGARSGASAGPYSMSSTVRCLNKAGAKVTLVRRTDSRRKAFSDLAQRTSREARFGRRSVLLAFTQAPSSATFLREALVVPDDPYVLRVKSNVVLMYRPGDATAWRKALRCLR